jgi:hypothetical protein
MIALFVWRWKGWGTRSGMTLQLSASAIDQKADIHGESRAFVLLETARLRCESLMAGFGASEQFMAIHREIGMAGFVTCADFEPEHRILCDSLASSRLAEDGPGRGPAQFDMGRTLATMFSETIAASDALACELADRDVEDAHRDRLHQVHAHVMSACELLDERLTVLELDGAGLDPS